MADKKIKPGKSAKPEPKPAKKAHEQADKDIEEDPDLNSKNRKEEDLDEGELANLEGED